MPLTYDTQAIYFINTIFSTVGLGDLLPYFDSERLYIVVLFYIGTLVFSMFLSEVDDAIAVLRCTHTFTHTHTHTHTHARVTLTDLVYIYTHSHAHYLHDKFSSSIRFLKRIFWY